jgi:hypothetical protein
MALRGQRNLDQGVEALPSEQRAVVRAQVWRVIRRATAVAALGTLVSLLVP